MNCDRMAKVFVKFCNVMLKYDHFPSRWLDVLDAMIEKCEGRKNNELGIMQIIEVKLKLTMREFLGMREEENYQNGARMSNHDCDFRKGC